MQYLDNGYHYLDTGYHYPDIKSDVNAPLVIPSVCLLFTEAVPFNVALSTLSTNLRNERKNKIGTEIPHA